MFIGQQNFFNVADELQDRTSQRKNEFEHFFQTFSKNIFKFFLFIWSIFHISFWSICHFFRDYLPLVPINIFQVFYVR